MTKEMHALAIAPLGNLDAYIRAANGCPMLTADEEKALAERLHYQGDLDAAKKLILSHLRFVVHIARNYAGYGLPQADLIQEGNIGLMKAVRRLIRKWVCAWSPSRSTGSKQKSTNMYCVTGAS